MMCTMCPLLVFKNCQFELHTCVLVFTREICLSFTYYSYGLSTATIEYSSLSVCLSVCLSWCLCVCLSVCVHDNSKNNGSIDVKLEQTVVYENSSDEFDIGHCLDKVKVTA